MSARTQAMAIAHGEHVVHFYEHEAGLVASVCPCLEAGVSAAFPADADSPRHARRMAAATLRRWGHGEALIADVSLIVSELASNAVRHAGSSFAVALQMQSPLLRVTVEDRAPLPDTASAADMLPRPPHGLCVVDSLATSWGIEPTRTGKIVWAQLLTYAAPLEP
jgi:anti-sigma regulatory factor (Ser/Thr protein kinase)